MVLGALLGIGLLPGFAGADGDVPPAQDDPPGCTTAAAEDDDGCGAQGRDNFGNAGHRPPIEACRTATAATGSTITRIVPQGPMRADGSLAFISGACVYLPPGYVEGSLRYPVVYLLHGGGGDQADWVTFGEVRRILDEAVAADPEHAAIVVMPDGRSGQYYDYLDHSYLNETYLLRHLVPAMDARFRTIADRAGRAIAGLSNGGYGALHLAAKAPDLFAVAGSMSGNLGARTMSGLGDTNEVYYQGNVPYQLASNLDAVDLIIDWGATCGADAAIDLCAAWGFEQAFRADNMTMRSRLDDVGYEGTVDYRETEGGHAWRWWTRWLAERDLPFFFDRLAAPTRTPSAPRSPLPVSFRYRSIAERFSIWGYDVAVTRDVREFADLTEVTVDGLTVQGSGLATITTAGRYAPGRTYRIEGAAEEPRTVVADPAGRLQIEVDLGPSHEQDQFTEDADLAEAQGGYWVQRTVRIVEDSAATAPLPSTSVDQPPHGGGYSAGPAMTTAEPDAEPAAVDSLAAPPPAARTSAPLPLAVITEPLRRVSIPLTVAFIASLIGAGALWWRRRVAKAST